MKIDRSLFFKGADGKDHFLFQILNYGKIDDLKFIFNAKDEGTGIVYSSDGSLVSKEDIIKQYSEISYHNDGVMHYKLPKDRDNGKDDYRDRFRRTPLGETTSFFPIIKYTVVSYDLCKKKRSSNGIFLPENTQIFNGEPFECLIYLGNLKYANPPNNQPSEMIFRVNDVAKDIDLIVWIYKSSYKGKIITAPNTRITVLTRGNIVEIVQENN